MARRRRNPVRIPLKKALLVGGVLAVGLAGYSWVQSQQNQPPGLFDYPDLGGSQQPVDNTVYSDPVTGVGTGAGPPPPLLPPPPILTIFPLPPPPIVILPPPPPVTVKPVESPGAPFTSTSTVMTGLADLWHNLIPPPAPPKNPLAPPKDTSGYMPRL
jgi:hypothetical protein